MYPYLKSLVLIVSEFKMSSNLDSFLFLPGGKNWRCISVCKLGGENCNIGH